MASPIPRPLSSSGPCGASSAACAASLTLTDSRRQHRRTGLKRHSSAVRREEGGVVKAASRAHMAVSAASAAGSSPSTLPAAAAEPGGESFDAFTRSLNVFATEKAGTRDAAIWSFSPVRGLRPSRAGSDLGAKEPKPTSITLLPSHTLSTIVSTVADRTSLAIFFVTPVRLAILETRSALLSVGTSGFLPAIMTAGTACGLHAVACLLATGRPP
mmetsp:Transcript_11596/g.30190  ORF Transcript_11596/g.30190 Transcript_11596/m.30190 type:complete len:215 (-) Transcript_11596:85-729(-)